MVNKNRSQLIKGRARPASPRSDVIVVRSTLASSSKRDRPVLEAEPDDVIDLGAPRLLRRAPAEGPRAVRPRVAPNRAPATPNPRLYPGPLRAAPKAATKRADRGGGGEGRGRRRKRAFRRVVPNSRLYRPAPARPSPPPALPRTAWAPPAPAARLDTASRAALRLSEQRRARPGPPPSPAPPRLVVTLPPGGAAPQRYRPASEHFRLRSLDTESGDSTPVAGRPGPPAAAAPAAASAMDAGNRNSTSPEDCSDGNETLSAPSEFLAEFLSAIMRRQYAEALKYCRLILQYEPHNATARGFYPLLQHKVQAHKRPDEEWPRGSSSEEASAPAEAPHAEPRDTQELMEQGGDSSDGSAEEGGSLSRSGGSCGSQSSLELDSSEAPARSSPSLSLSRRTEHTDTSGGCWDSTGSASRSDADDNGNAAGAGQRLCAGDVANDNAEPRHKVGAGATATVPATVARVVTARVVSERVVVVAAAAARAVHVLHQVRRGAGRTDPRPYLSST
ncbi:uncharacterized protein LOC142976785 isoform X2 [Anticarsia gemmatalis]|uniref:uncharacterized protein LOC142976785 isoform X2 n=1 Tax=Anticarsia gemmatalis TaxID=129554 RepID=UPI003F7756EC